MVELNLRPSLLSRRSTKSPEAFRTISEVADELDVPAHVLRFWEGKFKEIKPLKRGGGRRYYRPEDVDLLRSIRTLLYTHGYTIKGAQKYLREQHARQQPQAPPPAASTQPVAATSSAVTPGANAQPSLPLPEQAQESRLSALQRRRIVAAIDELQRVRALLGRKT